MTLFEVSTMGSLLGSPVAGAIVGLRSGLVGSGIGLAIGLVVGVAFHFGVCRLLYLLLKRADTFLRNRDTQTLRKPRHFDKLLKPIENLLSETILYGLLLSPLVSIPLTVCLVGIAVGP